MTTPRAGSRQTTPQPGGQHPDEWRHDLNPEAMAGQNRGLANPHPELDARTAYDVKPVHDRLAGFTDDELKQIPILPQGSRLEQGAVYVDLAQPRLEEFTARADMEAGSNNLYVLKSSVPYTVWNRLVGQVHPAENR